MNLREILLFSTIVALSDAADTGPPGPIKIFEIGQCDPSVNEISFTHNLKTDSNGIDSISTTFSLAEDLGEDTLFAVTVDKYDGSDWELNIYDLESQPLFKFLTDFIPNIWNNYREKVVPTILDINKIRAGDYKLDDFGAIYKDINTPQVYYGRLRANLYLTKGDVDILCLKVDVECNQPPDA